MEQIQNKTPLVRFPEFKDDWKHRQLNELLSVSKTKNSDLKYGKEEVLSVSGELGIVNQIAHLGRSYAGASVHNYGVAEVGNIVYTKSPLKANPYGIIKQNKDKAGIVSTLYAIYSVNDTTANGEFIEYYFSLNANTNRYLRPLVRKGAKNTLQISNSEFIWGKIFAPKKEEQKRIANFFTIIDKKLTQLKEKQALLEEYKKGMMQQLFSQELRFKDDNGNNFDDWEKKKLGNISIKVGSGKTPLGGEKVYQNYGVPFIRSQNVIKNQLVLDKTHISEKTNSKMKSSIVQINDILLNITGGSIGRSCVVPKTFSIGNVNQHVCIIRLNNKNNPFFIQSFLSSHNGQKLIFQNQTGSGREGLNFQSIKSFKFDIPLLKEQTKIANFLSKIDKKINVVNEQIEETKQYKKALLQQMFVN